MSETFRQVVHLLMGLLGAAVILRLDDQGALVFVSAVLVVLFLLCDAFTRGYDLPVLSGVMDEAERRARCRSKAVSPTLSALSSAWRSLGGSTPRSASSHSVCSTVSRPSPDCGLGGTPIRGSKSLEGTLTGAVAAALALIFLVPWWAAVVVAGVAGVVEAYSPLDDNVAIQVAVCLTLALMGVVVTVF